MFPSQRFSFNKTYIININIFIFIQNKITILFSKRDILNSIHFTFYFILPTKYRKHRNYYFTFHFRPKTPSSRFILPFITIYTYIHFLSPLLLDFRANRRIFHGCLKFDKNRAPPPVSLGQQGTGPITIGNACISTRSFRVSLPLSTAAAGIRAL